MKRALIILACMLPLLANPVPNIEEGKPADGLSHLNAYLAYTLKTRIESGDIDGALEMLQVIIDAESKRLGYDYEERMKQIANEKGSSDE